jgi:hypothetical protein
MFATRRTAQRLRYPSDTSQRSGRTASKQGGNGNRNHRPTGVVAAAAERRSQEQNRRVAVTRLRLALAVQHRTSVSENVEPSALWSSRCISSRIQCSDRHEHFPAMIAEALNAVHAKAYDVRRAAAALGCSTTQLIRFLSRAPAALHAVNRARLTRGLGNIHG